LLVHIIGEDRWQPRARYLLARHALNRQEKRPDEPVQTSSSRLQGCLKHEYRLLPEDEEADRLAGLEGDRMKDELGAMGPERVDHKVPLADGCPRRS
jgi:hypothetical protein